MQAAVRATIAVAVLAALSAVPPPEKPGATTAAVERPELDSACPAGTLPDQGVCIPFPRDPGAEALAAESGAHRDRAGRQRQYEHIPRRPDRGADYRLYRLPIASERIVSHYDLHRTADEQRRTETNVGHGGVDFAAERGQEIRIVGLEHQVGDAEVLYTGDLFGKTVVTQHSVREHKRLRTYVVLFGHLDETAPGVVKGRNAKDGALLGFAGDTGSPGNVHLHLEVRRVRDGVTAKELAPSKLVHNAYTIAVDPRNVLPPK